MIPGTVQTDYRSVPAEGQKTPHRFLALELHEAT